MRLCWRVKLKSVVFVLMVAGCLAGLAVLQRRRSPSSAELSRGARGGGMERAMEKERELEAMLSELQRSEKRETETEFKGEADSLALVREREREREREEEERRVVPRKALELSERESPRERREARLKLEEERGGGGQRHHLEREADKMRRFEALKQNQLRLSPGRRDNLRQMEPLGQGLPHSAVDLGDFDPEEYLAGQLLGEGESEMKRFQFNQLRSQQTPYNRELRDVRNPSCTSSKEDYQTDLPAVSVIICFHNEARSALLRTIYSVLQRSPPELLTEIVLVDDFSDNSEDGQLLAAIPKVHLMRMEERNGLMRARVRGAELARGQVLMFLDSHCEVTTGWLQPLLSRIKTNHTHVVSPIIDIINKDSMQYTSASPLVKGGFGHNLHFRWDQMPQKEIQSRARIIDPIRTPAIAGGLFAVDKTWFRHLGLYDTQMEIWGGENIELSLRVWMCGGVLEIIPCSRVGHIFRSAMPYTFGPGGTYHNTVAKNIRRTVEVWLDEYKPFYYEQNPFSLGVKFGDISERLALRRRLQCKPFSWYLKNIYPHFDAPPVQDFTYGQLRHEQMCLDSLGRHSMQPPELRLCEPQKGILGGTQGWAMTKNHEVKSHTLCLTLDSGKLLMKTCSGSAKQFFHLHGNGVIQHGPTNSCLSASNPRLNLEPCDVTSHNQIWKFVVLPSSTNSSLH